MRILRENLDSLENPGEQMKQRELARLLRVHPSLLSMAEHGRVLGGRTIVSLFDGFKDRQPGQKRFKGYGRECARLGLTEGDFLRGVRS